MVAAPRDVVDVDVAALCLVVAQIGAGAFRGALAQAVGERGLAVAGQAGDSEDLATAAATVPQEVGDGGGRGGLVGRLDVLAAEAAGGGAAGGGCGGDDRGREGACRVGRRVVVAGRRRGRLLLRGGVCREMGGRVVVGARLPERTPHARGACRGSCGWVTVGKARCRGGVPGPRRTGGIRLGRAGYRLSSGCGGPPLPDGAPCWVAALTCRRVTAGADRVPGVSRSGDLPA